MSLINKKELEKYLLEEKKNINSVVPFDFTREKVFIFDLTEANEDLKKLDLSNTENFNTYIFETLKNNNSKIGAGGYGEDRYIYRRSSVFSDREEPRSIHLGIDLWADAGTKVYAPIDGKIHSFKNNDSFGNYGPTIILEHSFNDETFFTLYGHLNMECLENLFVDKKVSSGDEIAEFGKMNVNGNWPPHLHFQIITDILGNEGDFPGVAAPSESDYYLSLCPDPNLILNIPALK